jgi:hypothetical protein
VRARLSPAQGIEAEFPAPGGGGELERIARFFCGPPQADAAAKKCAQPALDMRHLQTENCRSEIPFLERGGKKGYIPIFKRQSSVPRL